MPDPIKNARTALGRYGRRPVLNGTSTPGVGEVAAGMYKALEELIGACERMSGLSSEYVAETIERNLTEDSWS